MAQVSGNKTVISIVSVLAVIYLVHSPLANVVVFQVELINLFVFAFTPQEENLWQKEREEELHRTMTQLNLLDKHKNAFTKKNMFISQEHMVRFTDSGDT